MQFNRLANKVGCGIMTEHEKYLTEKGYTILQVYLLMLEDYDLWEKIPVMDGKEIKFIESNNSIPSLVKKIHEKGEKVAIFLQEYETNKKRFPTLMRLIDKEENVFNLNENDIVVFKSDTGVKLDPIY